MIFRCICGNCQTIPTEEESIYFQEVMQVVAKLDDFNGGSPSESLICISGTQREDICMSGVSGREGGGCYPLAA